MHVQVIVNAEPTAVRDDDGPLTRWFSRYDLADHLARPASACAVWLTGQNTLRHSTLSPEESAVLDDLEDRGYATVRCGFPYNAAAVDPPFRKEHWLPAAVRCMQQYVAAGHSPSFAAVVARHLQPVLDATRDHLLLLVGSCGARMLGAAMPLLRVPEGLALHVVALGPVGTLPELPGQLDPLVVRGRWDVLSVTLSRGPGVRVDCGHLGYLRCPEARARILTHAERALR